MYRLVRQLINIQNVFTSGNDCIYVSKSEDFFFNDVKVEGYKSIYFCSNNYIIKNSEKSSFLFINDSLVRELKHTYFTNTLSNEAGIYYENLRYDVKDDKIKKDIYYHNFQTNNILLIGIGLTDNILFIDYFIPWQVSHLTLSFKHKK